MSHDDFDVEPVRGLPERLPAGEHILWQGSPRATRLAREALCLDWIVAYALILVIWRVAVSATMVPFGIALLHGVPFVLAGLVAAGLIWVVAWAQARATVYTLTNKRVVMRIGAALTMTLNLPYTWIGRAHLDLRQGGTGTIALELLGETRLSYLMTWPNVRPWVISRTQPALRCIPDAARVAAILAEAAETRVSEPKVERVAAPSAMAAE